MQHVRVTDDGARIGFVELPGKEPTRVFIHGLGSSSLPYFTHIAAAPALIENRSLLVDLLGFGISDRPRTFGYTLPEQADGVARLLDSLNISAADVIAHSMGGAVAVTLASKRPDLVGRLVVAEPNLRPTDRPRIEGYSEEEFIQNGFQEALATTGEVWPVTMRLADPVAMYRSEDALGKNMIDNLGEVFLNLRVPRLMIRGAKTPSIHCEDEIRAAEIPLVSIANAGHNMMLDNAPAFTAALAAFLA